MRYDDGMKDPDELTTEFRTRGFKVTPQRRKIFEVLSGSELHPSAEMVYQLVRTEMPTISLRTVYQTLNDLAAMGEIASLDLGTGATRFDPTSAPHHHLVCTECGAIRDLHSDFPDVTVPPVAADDFTVTATEIVFRGLCRTCTQDVRQSGDVPQKLLSTTK